MQQQHIKVGDTGRQGSGQAMDGEGRFTLSTFYTKLSGHCPVMAQIIIIFKVAEKSDQPKDSNIIYSW